MAFEPDKFRKSIKKAGYEVRDFQLTLQAIVAHREHAYWLDLAGTQNFKVKPDMERPLEPLVGKKVRARGKVIAESEAIELELTELGLSGE